MRKRKTRDEVIDHLLKTDENFRTLHAKVISENGGRLPSSDEIGRRLAERIARARRS